MSEVWNGLKGGLGSLLNFLHDSLEPLLGGFAWGWAIIALTILVRIVLLPLAIKQTMSMRATQRLAPEIKKIQAKYKADRGLLRSDPDKFKDLRAKQQEAMAGLYKEHGVNPAASCLPLVAQMPIFFALYTVLRDSQYVPTDASWYLGATLSEPANAAGIGAYLLLALMGVTTFISQRQTMASNPAMADNPQQKTLLYVMPVMLVFFGFNLPVGVLLYWVTTNLWTMAQQQVMFRVQGGTPGADGIVAAGSAPVLDGGTPPAGQPGPSDAGPARAPGKPKGQPTPKRGATRAPAAEVPSGRGKGRTSSSGPRQKRT